MVNQKPNLVHQEQNTLRLNKEDKPKIYNLSTKPLTDDEIDILNLGPKFVPHTPVDKIQLKTDILNFSRTLLLKASFFDKTDYIDESLIKPVSNFVPKITKFPVLKSIIEDLELFANDLDSIEKKPISDNLTKNQRLGLESLKSRKDIIIFKADKGNSLVILDKDFYENKVMEKLTPPTFVERPRNSDYFIILKLKRLTKTYATCLTKKEKLAICNFDYKSTCIYALPKIHKSEQIRQNLIAFKGSYVCIPRPEDLSFRVIFGGPKNPTTGLASLLNEILNPFVSKVYSVVRDTTDFLNRMPVFEAHDLAFIEMWSVDIKDMYPSIKNELGLEALRFWLEKFPNLLPSRFSIEFILESMLFILNNNIGYFNGKYFQQVVGTATGIKPAPPYANLTVGYMEIMLFRKLEINLGKPVANYFWKHYRRFLDDGQIMWDTRLGDFNKVLDLMNMLDPCIRFTSECSNDRLVYLDLVILKTKTGFETEIHQKETDGGAYLPFMSSHPSHTKRNIPYSLARRIRALTDNDEVCINKMNVLKENLLALGYPLGIVKTAVHVMLNTNKNSLRIVTSREGNNNVLAFVHDFDPSLPQIFQEVKKLTSRIFSSRELKPIFKDFRLLDSQREPPNLLRLLQHSKYDGNTEALIGTKVTKCGMLNCKLCRDILEVDEVHFRNSDKTWKIKVNMTCIVRNVIYALFCKKCGHSYVGETVHFRTRMNAHRSCSSSEGAAVMEVSRHLFDCGLGFWACPLFKMREENKIARLVREDYLIDLLQPDLNADKRNLLHLSLGPPK